MRITRNNRRLIFIGAFLVAAILCIAGWLVLEQRRAAIAETQRATANMAQVLAEQTARTLMPVDLAVREIQNRLESAAPDIAETAGSAATFDMLVERLKGLPQASALVLIGADGRLLSTTRSFPPPKIDMSEREIFRHFSVDDDHTVYVSKPLRSYFNASWTVFFGRRINGRNGAFAGVAAATFTLASLEDFYAAVTPQEGSVTLLRRDGTMLVHYPHLDQAIGVKLPAEAPWYRVVSQGGGSYRSPGYFSGVPALFAVRPLRDFPLVIDASASEVSALAAWKRNTAWLLFGAAVAIACVITLLHIFGRQVARLQLKNRLLKEGRQQFDAVLDNMSQGITFIDRDLRLIISNRRYREMYRLPAEQVRAGTALSDVLGFRLASASFPDMTTTAYLARRTALVGAGRPFDIVDELLDGRTIAMHYQPMPDGGYVTTHEDITERRRAEARLVFMARHDGLTELPNRTMFQERLADAIALTRLGTQCAVLCLDLDGFKAVNDTLGHPVGDALLRVVAQRLSAAVREIDTVARLGGDEFAIIQVGLENAEAAAGLADRILRVIHQPYELDGERIVIGISIGVAMAPGDGTSPGRLLKNADIALYLAKTEGRGTFRFFEREMDARLQSRRVLELDLRRALPTDDFSLHYQPIIALQTGKVEAFEALIRWNHPDRGSIPPADFIPIAEETALIVPIGAWVLRRACEDAAGWPDDIGVSVNLSSAQFKGGHLFGAVQEALSASGLNPSRLILEITESVLLQKNEAQVALLHRFRGQGIRIALDDFGTGFSSLSYLCGFPFDSIKIDQSFVRDIGANAESKVIVSAVADLARGLGMTTTAEGVETGEQLAAVRALGCTTVQGYLFSRPVPADAVPDLIRSLSGSEVVGEVPVGHG
nr:EAL domain-containing protein [uncultured Rhodopila sp.]